MTDPRTARAPLPKAPLSLAVAIVAAIGGLIACGGPSSSTTTTFSPMPSGSTGSGTSTTASPSATPVTGDAGDPQLLPLPSDTPFQQAPPGVQAEWQSYFAQGIVTVVPNSTVPYQRPATPRVQNATAGAVSDATAQSWGDAFMRQTAWATWAINHNQLQLLYETSSRSAYPGLALPAGATGFQVVGSQYAGALKLVKIPASTQAFLHVNDQYAFIVTVQGSGGVNALFADGHAEPLSNQSFAAGDVSYLTGAVVTKPLLGDIWYGTNSNACNVGEPAPIQQLCGQ